MIPKEGISPQYLREALRRRFWYVVIPFFVISLITILHCIRAPRIFKAETFILVEPQKIPGEFVTSTITIDLARRLRNITPQIKSRTRLEKIINEYDLYPGIRANATMSDAVAAFARSIEINANVKDQAFELSFQGKDPPKVRDVTNTLASLFIEDNLRLRGEQAAGTTRFLDREIQKVQKTLEEKDMALREFKERHLGLLPENMARNQQMLAHLQQRLDSISATLQQTKDRRVLLETQLTDLRRIGAQMPATGSQDGGFASGAPDLGELQNRLTSLKSRYTDKHPDVVRTEAAIERLRKELKAQQEEGASEVASADHGRFEGYPLLSGQTRDLATQILSIDTELKNLVQQQGRIEAERDIYRQRVEDMPRVEQMLGDLTRGYNDVRENYSNLLEKKFQAGLSENLEIAQQGEQFTILDRAQLPDKPFKPETRKVLLMGLGMALAGGFGLAFLREHLDPSFFGTKELESTLQLPVLASIPVILTDADRKRILFGRSVSGVALLAMASILLYALYFLWKSDPMGVFTAVI